MMENNFQWLTRGNVSMPQLDLPRVERWIRDVAATHNRICGPLTYVFCDDPTILDVNRQFLSHDYFTDIITFDDSRGRLLRGDMFISLDTVRSNAEGLACEYGRELMRVIIMVCCISAASTTRVPVSVRLWRPTKTLPSHFGMK